MDNLDEFLKGNDDEVQPVDTAPADPPAAEAPTEEAKPETVERPRGPDGKFIPKGEKQPDEPAPDAPPAPEEPQLDHAALIGERRRRQEAEQRLQEMERQLQERLNPPAAPTAIPDQWEDPEGFANYLKSEAVKQAVDAARQEAFQTFQTQRIEMSAAQFAPTVSDYAEKVQVFEQMMQTNPALLQELYRAQNPAEYAYNTAKTHLEVQQFGGLEGLIKARVEEALKAQVPEAPPSPPVPDTLADAQSARGSAAEANHVPSLDEIVGKAFR